jgi:hypothetical protein
MEAREKKILKALSLELRHLLEGQYDSAGHWHAGDLEQRLNAIGVWRERTMPADEMHLSPDDNRARSVVDAYLKLRDEAGVRLAEAVAEFVRETAYTWANRLLALRCMEARELIDEVILQKEVYGGRSLEHHRLIQRQPELGAGEDDGLFAALDAAFARQAEHLPLLFDPKAPGVALKPSVAAIKRCVALLSGNVDGYPADDNVFKAPDALGWAYQYWNTEEKDRVFETVRTKKGAKIEGADIIPATQLYTEDYMVKFLVQNSLGATWVGMTPDTKLVEGWEYFVRDADRAPVEKKPVSEITFLDPACGSGHFLIEAFDLFFDMYQEEGLGSRDSGLGKERIGVGDGDSELSGSEGLAGEYGSGERCLSGNQRFSEGGDIRTDQPVETGSGIGSLEHSRGACEKLDAGISPSSFDVSGLAGRGGDTTDTGKSVGIYENGNPAIASEESKRDRQNASWSAEIPSTQTPVSSPQPLTPGAICRSIIENNLFGIDIDQRAVQISEAALWMKAAEKCINEGDYAFLAPSPQPLTPNLVATNIRLPRNKDHLRDFLAKHPEDKPLAPALEAVFEALQHADELGSLLQLEEPVEKELKLIKQRQDEEASVPRSQVLFEEMRRPVQTVLPVGADDWDTWKTRTIERIREHFSEQAEAANLQEQFFGIEAGKGWKLFELLGRKYDVVAANPPYMGSKNMGVVLKAYVNALYSTGKRDVYAAFILRCLGLTEQAGRTAMVTQQSWMFLRSFAGLRASEDSGKPGQLVTGLLREVRIEALVHLGEHAFDDSSAAGAFVVLFTLNRCPPGNSHRLTAFRLVGSKDPVEKATCLCRICSGQQIPAVRFSPLQSELSRVPGGTLCYWLSGGFLHALTVTTVGDKAKVCQGLATGNDLRFVRFVWETPDERPNSAKRWFLFEKGGGYGRWCGHQWWRLDWASGGARVRSFSGSVIRNEDQYFSRGWTYSDFARGSLGPRIMENAVFSSQSPAAIPNTANGLGLILSSRITSYMVRSLSAQINHMRESYVKRLPFHGLSNPRIADDTEHYLVVLAMFAASMDPTEFRFAPELLSIESQIMTLRLSCLLHATEGFGEALVFDCYAPDETERQNVLYETGTPVGWHPLSKSHAQVPEMPECHVEIPQDVSNFIADIPRIALLPQQLVEIKLRLRSLYTSGPGMKADIEQTDDPGDDSSEEEAVIGARIPIPATTFLEELSQKLEIHPISVYWLLKEGIEKEGWRCLPEERRITSDRLTVTILRMLGHRWPKQIEAGEPVPDWADPDGVIPLGPGAGGSGLVGEKTLYERILDLGRRDDSPVPNPESLIPDFEEIMGKPLNQWLVTDFFRTHISQFKKRPIAWQLQIGKFNGRKSPAFACMAYYHKLSESFLPTIQSQYIRPLRQRFETELRGIENIPAASRTGDQTARRVELTALIDELNDFDSRLDQVTNTGFATPMLRQYAIDDAMLALKARWLRRLSAIVVAGPLAEWNRKAEEELGARGWGLEGNEGSTLTSNSQPLTPAFTHLDYFCAKVGPAAPDEKKLDDDPTSADLAKLIAPKAKSMVSDSLKLACDVWWKTFDDVVLGPIKEQIKALNEEHKTLDAEHKILTGKAEPASDKAAEFEQLSPTERADRVRELERRMKQIKLEIKPLRDEQNQKTDKAKKLRTTIEKWTCPEAETWESWLASQPLYDQVSALDGQRQPPTTVADFIRQESLYAPDINDGVRVNIAPIQKIGLLAADVLATKDLDKAIADRAEWRSDERRWVREGKLPQPGWWEGKT